MVRYPLGMLTLLALLACTGPSDTGADSADTGGPQAPVTVRVMTWNVEGLGRVGSEEHDAAVAVVRRLSPDVLLLNELDEGDADGLAALADALDYPFTLDYDDNPFGSLHNGVVARGTVIEDRVWTSAALSSDDAANDLTRLPVHVVLSVGGRTVAAAGNHWKSGYESADRFRRAVDGHRMAQLAERVAADVRIVCGDVNEDLADDDAGEVYERVPSGMPSGFALGEDLQARVDGDGLPYSPFVTMADAGLDMVDALQLDGRSDTRASSGRRIDYCFAAGDAAIVAEVYDSRDDAADEGLPKPGPIPDDPYATEHASDHLPVFVDLTL